MNDFVDWMIVGIQLCRFKISFVFIFRFLIIYFDNCKLYHHYPKMVLIVITNEQVTVLRNYREFCNSVINQLLLVILFFSSIINHYLLTLNHVLMKHSGITIIHTRC